MDALEINERLTVAGISEGDLRAEPEGAEPGSDMIVLTGFLLNQLADADAPGGMILGSVAVGEAEAIRVLDEVVPGWRADSDT